MSQPPYRIQDQGRSAPVTQRPMYDRDGNEVGVEIGGDLSFDTSFTLSRVHNRTPTVPPPGLYVVTLNGIFKETENRFNPDVDRLRFDFLVNHVIDSSDPRKADEFVDSVIHGWVNNTMGPKATLRAWAEALLQRSFDADDQLQPADLIGKQAKATYTAYVKDNGQPGVKLSNLAPYQPAVAPPSRSQPARPQPASRTTSSTFVPGVERLAPSPAPQRPARPVDDDPAINEAISDAFDGPAADPWDRPSR